MSTTKEDMSVEDILDDFYRNMIEAKHEKERSIFWAEALAALNKLRREDSEIMQDWGSWMSGKCDLHEKYTSACCGCQKERHALKVTEQYKEYQSRVMNQRLSGGKEL